MRRLTLATLALTFAACSDDPATTPPPGGNTDASAQSGVDSGMADAGPPPNPTCHPAFAAADACGGNLEGSWTYRAGCSDDVDLGAVSQQCPGVMARETARTTSGTLTMNGDRTFVRHASGTASYMMDVPAACAQPVGGCANFATAASAALSTQVACTANGTSCACTATIPYDTNDSGTYAIAGSMVTVTVNGTATSYNFCASAGVLEYRQVTSAGDPRQPVFVATK